MPRTSTRPSAKSQFKSEAEEADWYATPAGRRETQREFQRALRSNVAVRSKGSKVARTDPKLLKQLMEQAKANATRAISIRLPIADLELAQKIAAEKGVGYQGVLKQAIRDGLKRLG
ncbi:MAG: hypothetical protein ACRD7E_19090 [Bryobacteraceae bacterium]